MQSLGLSPTPKPTSRLRTWIWPDLSVAPEIDSTLHLAKVTSFVVAILTAGVALLSQVHAALIDAVLYSALRYGIGKKSRVAAVGAFGLYGANVLITLPESFGLMTLVITLLLFNGMRATFAHEKRQDPAEMKNAEVQTVFETAVKAEVSGDTATARGLFEKILQDHPSSKYVADARSSIAALERGQE